MNKRLLDILRANFLLSDTAPRNWRFLIFFAFLGILDVTSSHLADWQVHRNEQLEEQVKWLKYDLLNSQQNLHNLIMESRLEEAFAGQGLKRPDSIVRKYVVNTIDPWQRTNKK